MLCFLYELIRIWRNLSKKDLVSTILMWTDNCQKDVLEIQLCNYLIITTNSQTNEKTQ